MDRYYSNFEVDDVCYLVEQTNPLKIKWDGEYIGDVSRAIKKMPVVGRTKLYYNSFGSFFMLEKRSTLARRINCMIEIFKLNNRRFHWCKYRGKNFFMKEAYPDDESYISINTKRKYSLDRVLIILFHWILGISGRIIERDMDEFGTIEYFSCGPYKLNHKTSFMTLDQMKHIFKSVKHKKELGSFFNSKEKIDKLFDYLHVKNRWWYLEIVRRIRLI